MVSHCVHGYLPVFTVKVITFSQVLQHMPESKVCLFFVVFVFVLTCCTNKEIVHKSSSQMKLSLLEYSFVL